MALRTATETETDEIVLLTALPRMERIRNTEASIFNYDIKCHRLQFWAQELFTTDVCFSTPHQG